MGGAKRNAGLLSCYISANDNYGTLEIYKLCSYFAK
jgi:hypothetical protein